MGSMAGTRRHLQAVTGLPGEALEVCTAAELTALLESLSDSAELDILWPEEGRRDPGRAPRWSYKTIPVSEHNMMTQDERRDRKRRMKRYLDFVSQYANYPAEVLKEMGADSFDRAHTKAIKLFMAQRQGAYGGVSSAPSSPSAVQRGALSMDERALHNVQEFRRGSQSNPNSPGRGLLGQGGRPVRSIIKERKNLSWSDQLERPADPHLGGDEGFTLPPSGGATASTPQQQYPCATYVTARAQQQQAQAPGVSRVIKTVTPTGTHTQIHVQPPQTQPQPPKSPAQKFVAVPTNVPNQYAYVPVAEEPPKQNVVEERTTIDPATGRVLKVERVVVNEPEKKPEPKHVVVQERRTVDSATGHVVKVEQFVVEDTEKKPQQQQHTVEHFFQDAHGNLHRLPAPAPAEEAKTEQKVEVVYVTQGQSGHVAGQQVVHDPHAQPAVHYIAVQNPAQANQPVESSNTVVVQHHGQEQQQQQVQYVTTAHSPHVPIAHSPHVPIAHSPHTNIAQPPHVVLGHAAPGTPGTHVQLTPHGTVQLPGVQPLPSHVTHTYPASSAGPSTHHHGGH